MKYFILFLILLNSSFGLAKNKTETVVINPDDPNLKLYKSTSKSLSNPTEANYELEIPKSEKALENPQSNLQEIEKATEVKPSKLKDQEPTE